MKIFEQFNPEGPACIICGTVDNKPCTLVPIYGSNEGMTYEAEVIHIDCLDLVFYKDKGLIVQKLD